MRDAQLAGTVHVLFTIAPNGSVSATEDAGSSLADEQVVSCVLGVFAQLEFPPGGATQVSYPVRFGTMGTSS